MECIIKAASVAFIFFASAFGVKNNYYKERGCMVAGFDDVAGVSVLYAGFSMMVAACLGVDVLIFKLKSSRACALL